MREGNTQTVTECQHAPAVGRTRPGGEFFKSFLTHLGSILDAIFDDFAMIVALPFRDLFLMNCSSFPNRFLNRANHEIIKNTLVYLGYSTVGTFRTRTRVMKIAMQISHNCRIEFSINSIIFRHKLPQRCFLQFVMEICPQNGRFCIAWGSQKSILFATRSERQTFLYILVTL